MEDSAAHIFVGQSLNLENTPCPKYVLRVTGAEIPLIETESPHSADLKKEVDSISHTIIYA